jgi:hypothetical protein
MNPQSDEPAAERPEPDAARLLRLFETPQRLLEAVIAAEILGPPLALRDGTTSGGRDTF